MNDIDNACLERAIDLVEWLDLRIAQRVEQRLAQERQHRRCHVVDLIAAEREQFVALLQKKHETVIEVLKADHKEIFDWVQRILEQSKKQAMAGFVPMCRPDDDDGEPPPSTH